MESRDLDRLVEFPSLAKIEEEKLCCSIGLSDWSKNVRSSVQEDGTQLNHFVEIHLIKSLKDVKYEIIETEGEIVIRYFWDHYDPTEDDKHSFNNEDMLSFFLNCEFAKKELSQENEDA